MTKSFKHISILLTALCLALSGNIRAEETLSGSATFVEGQNYPQFLIPVGNVKTDKGAWISAASGSDNVAKLVDRQASTNWYSGDETESVKYIEVTLGDIMADADEGEQYDLVVYTRRHVYDRTEHPLALKVVYSTDGANFVTDAAAESAQGGLPAFAFFLYRGRNTEEYSGRIHLGSPAEYKEKFGEGGIKKLRFIVTSNNSHTRVNKSESPIRTMRMGEFNIMLVGHNQDYSSLMTDRLHLRNDYFYDYKDFGFTNTLGILDNTNAVSGWESLTGKWNRYKYTNAKGESRDTVVWNISNKEKQLLEKAGISMPDFTPLSSANNKDILPGTGFRQPTHTVEHILYAIPGDAITLYPYYDMYINPYNEAETFHYYGEVFSHWYDFTTGGHLTTKDEMKEDFNVLDFLIDASGIQKTDNHGFVGGAKLTHTYNATVEAFTPQDVIAFARRVNSGERKLNLRLTADIDFTGVTDFTPIGTETYRFMGVIDGRDPETGRSFTIKNLVVDGSTKDDNVGFIGYAGGNAQLLNLNFDSGCRFTGHNRVGLIGAYGASAAYKLTIKGVHTEATIEAKSTNPAGNSGGGTNAGGLLGANVSESYVASGGLLISNCYVGGTIKGFDESGVITGWAGRDVNGTSALKSISNVVTAAQMDYTGYDEIYARHAVGTKVTLSNCHSIESNWNHFTGSVTQTPYEEHIVNGISVTTSYCDLGLLLSQIREKLGEDCGWSLKDNKIMAPTNAEREQHIEGKTVYQIATKADLEGFRDLVGFGKGKIGGVEVTGNAPFYAELTADIDFGENNNTHFEPIGKYDRMFSGSIDGKGHTISNLYVSGTSGEGFIGWCKGDVELININFDATCRINGTGNGVGIIGDYNSGGNNYNIHIEGVNSYATITGSGTNIAGLLGVNRTNSGLTIKNCVVGGSITGGSESAAITGWMGNNNASKYGRHVENVVSVATLNFRNGQDKTFVRYRTQGTGNNYVNIEVKNCYDINANPYRTQLHTISDDENINTAEWIEKNIKIKSNTAREKELEGYIDYYYKDTQKDDQKRLDGIAEKIKENNELIEEQLANIERINGELADLQAQDDDSSSFDWTVDAEGRLIPPVFISGINSSESVKISSYQELIDFSKDFNNGVYDSDVHVELTADIVFPDGVSYYPIGTDSHPFTGIFDGKGHSISNLKYNGGNDTGLIGVAKGNPGIYNLILTSDCSFRGAGHVGLVGQYNGHNNDKITFQGIVCSAYFSGNDNVGAIIGCNMGDGGGTYPGGYSISDCYVDAKIDGLGTGTFGTIVGWGGKYVSSESEKTSEKHLTNIVSKADTSLKNLVGTTSSWPLSGMNLTFENCYADIPYDNYFQIINLTDETSAYELATKLEAYSDSKWKVDTDGVAVPEYAVDDNSYEFDETISISSGKELAEFSTKFNNGDYKDKFIEVKLAADINMLETGETTFRSIGSESNPFHGVFDGGGHTISNMQFSTSTSYVGLIGYAKDATIKNIEFDNCSFSGTNNVGVVGYVRNTGTIMNITFNANCGIYGGGFLGIVGCYNGCVYKEGMAENVEANKDKDKTIQNQIIFKNVVNKGTISGTGTNIGGLLGQVFSEGGSSTSAGFVVDNCLVTGLVKSTSGSQEISGMIGWGGKANGAAAEKIISNSYFNGTLTGAGASVNEIVRLGAATATLKLNAYNCYIYNSKNSATTKDNNKPDYYDLTPKTFNQAFASKLSSSGGASIKAQIANLEAQVADSRKKIEDARAAIEEQKIERENALKDKAAHDAFNEENERELEEIKSLANWAVDEAEGATAPLPPTVTVTLPDQVTDNCERKYGSVATFFYPRNANESDGKLHGFFDLKAFPLLDDKGNRREEFVIAADFSQSFDPDINIVPAEYDAEGNKTKNGEFIEPVIQFRHIFRIRDGVKFADEFSGSVEANREYVKKNLRHIQARSNADFQVRFDSPVPIDGSGIEPVRSKYYYKIADDDYRRVCSMNVRVTRINDDSTEADKVLYEGTLNKSDKPEQIFYATGSFDGQGSRNIDGVDYYIGGGGAKYNRFLACDAKDTREGRYRVELIGLDYNSEPIIVYGGDDTEGNEDYLIVQEFVIDFVGDEAASLVVDSELYDSNYSYFKHAREEELEEEYGEPLGKITYDYKVFENDDLDGDSYRLLNEANDITITRLRQNGKDITKENPNDGKSAISSSNFGKSYGNERRLKWPVAWDQSGYSFGYDQVYDYNTYIIASHASMARFKDAACGAAGYTVKDNTGAIYADDVYSIAGHDGDDEANSSSSLDHETIYDGLYDRLYYDSRIKYPNDPDKWESGYFWYVNASNDPGVMARLNLKEFCPGSTITVSAWVAECSNHKEVANLAFNFVAVTTDGDRIPIHSFVTGYVTQRNTLQTNSKGEVVKDRAGNVVSAIVDTPPAILGTQNAGFAGRHVGWPLGHWMNVYYSFVPNLLENGITEAEVDHYELELDNNCKSSEGADYAVDNIRMYVSVPRVYADQLSPVCDPSDRRAEVKVHAPFDMLLQAFGLEENQDIISSPPSQSEDLVGGAVEEATQTVARKLGTRAEAEEDSKRVTLYYAFIDMEAYDKALENIESPTAEDIQNAFDAGVIKYNYDGNGERSYGRVTFSTDYAANKAYVDATSGDGRICYRQRIDGVRQLAFTTTPAGDDKLKVGHDFIIAFWMPSDYKSMDETPVFDIYDKCSKYGVFRLKGTTEVKIDGINVPSNSEFEGCQNQQPVVQIAVQGMDETDNTMVVIDDNAYCDWFYGTRAEYDAFKQDVTYVPTEDVVDGDGNVIEEKGEETTKEVVLVNALTHFRNEYPDATDCSDLEPKGDLSAAELELIRLLSTQDEKNKDVVKLTLHKSSYTFPPIKFEYETDEKGEYLRDEEGHRIMKDDSQASVVAIPIVGALKEHPENYVVCTEPSQIDINVKKSSPDLLHGIPGIEYPTELEDVPLRAGLDQLASVSVDLDTADVESAAWLDVPVRYLDPTSKYVTYFRYADDRGVYLVQTDDPAYKDLDPYPATRANDGIGLQSDESPFEPVGELVYLRSRVRTNTEAYKAADNFMGIVFDERFKFHEGYTYRFRFNFEEARDAKDAGDANANTVFEDIEGTCPGQHVFTIKVVPEYQKWTGAVNANWNNDANWERVSSADLKRDSNDSKLKSQKYNELGDETAAKGYEGEGEDWTQDLRDKTEYVADRKDDNKASFAPLDFTKVVIDPANYPELKHPHLYDVVETTEVKVFHHKDKDDAGTTAEFTFVMPKEADYEAVSAGETTEWIEYDMAARYFDGGLGVRPWMSQTARDVHFAPGAEILNQQWLAYERAWVEMEVNPTRWYTLSSPMASTIAGDMYLPTLTAREESQLFLPITFSTKLHNRFDPAVFQRGWNKAEAIVHELPNADNAGSSGNTENVAVSLAWSNVYNEVTENYAGGTGFSVKTDVSRLNSRLGEGKDVEKVLFRLPKHDSFYEYYEDKTGGYVGDKTGNSQTSRYRLAFENGVSEGKITVTGAKTDTEYFLVGNPFMAHIDMEKFIDGNSGRIEPMYWIVSADKSGACIIKDGEIISTGEDGGETDAKSRFAQRYLPPFQGFFVKAKSKAKELNLTYTPDMIHVEDPVAATLAMPAVRSTRSADLRPLRIKGVSGAGNSVAVVDVSAESMPGYDAGEDAAVLIDRSVNEAPIVYTIAGGMAAAINSVPRADGIEIGVDAPGEDLETILSLTDVAVVEGMYLFDKENDSLTEIEEGMTLTVKGSSRGRYFIVSGRENPEDEISTLRIDVAGNMVTVSAGGDDVPVEVNVYDVAGRTVLSATDLGRVEFDLDRGAVYIIEAATGEERTSRKLAL